MMLVLRGWARRAVRQRGARARASKCQLRRQVRCHTKTLRCEKIIRRQEPPTPPRGVRGDLQAHHCHRPSTTQPPPAWRISREGRADGTFRTLSWSELGGGRALEAREAPQSGGTPPPRTSCVSEANHRVRARRWDVRASGTDAFEDRGGTFALLVHASWQVRARLSFPPPAGWAPASDDKSPLARGANERMCMARGADCDGTGWCAPETTFLAGVSSLNARSRCSGTPKTCWPLPCIPNDACATNDAGCRA